MGSHGLPGPQEGLSGSAGSLEEGAVALGWINQEFLLRDTIGENKREVDLRINYSGAILFYF